MINTELKATAEAIDNSEPPQDATQNLYAAVDLGSNSFHLVISRYQHGEFTVIDRQREVVRLAGGLDENNLLSDEVSERALACLNKFGQLLRSLPSECVRVVGTNALRRLHQKMKFLNAAEKALGHSIEIIAGREEARLIYLGVSKWSVSQEDSRLVIDIGGGSTEIIVGKGDVPLCRESLEVGCVVLSNQFFKDGKLSSKRFNKAVVAAELAIQPVVQQFRVHGWSQAIGCSGTMRSLNNCLLEGGWSKDGINRESLNNLLEHVLEFKHVDDLQLPGLTRDRSAVFPGGLAILIALQRLFEIREISVSDIALREGVLYDLVGRRSAEDIRGVTVAAMVSRSAIEIQHGERVRDTAIELYNQIAQDWDIHTSLFKDMLGWAAQLHELGTQISHDGYHKHGAYMVANADMAGFARRDQLLLSALIAGHRRKFPIDVFEQLPSNLVTPAKRVAVILRLAVLFHRGREMQMPSVKQFSVKGQQVDLRFENDYLDDHPLTLADLQLEAERLKVIGLVLTFR